MSQKYYGSIIVSKIDMDKAVTLDNGNQKIDIVVWVNDAPDQYGNDMSIQQKTEQGDKKNYLGNCRKSQKVT